MHILFGAHYEKILNAGLCLRVVFYAEIAGRERQSMPQSKGTFKETGSSIWHSCDLKRRSKLALELTTLLFAEVFKGRVASRTA
jgi:hypothetical protein